MKWRLKCRWLRNVSVHIKMVKQKLSDLEKTEKLYKQMDRGPETYGIVSKGLTNVWLNSHMENETDIMWKHDGKMVPQIFESCVFQKS